MHMLRSCWFRLMVISTMLLLSHVHVSEGSIRDEQGSLIRVHTKDLDIVFASLEKGMGLVSLKHAGTGDEFLATHRTATSPILWELEFADDIHKKGSFFSINNRSPAVSRESIQTEESLILKWSGIQLPSGSVDVVVEISHSDFHDMREIGRAHV